MFRFSRDKRFFGKMIFKEFLEAGIDLADLVRSARPSAIVEVLTCEDLSTYNYSTVTFASDEVIEALQGRKSYTLEELSEAIWQRSLNLQVTIRDPSDSLPFMICLSHDKSRHPRRMAFYGQSVEDRLAKQISKRFGCPSLFVSIGDGHNKPSSFNVAFGRRIAPIRGF